MIPPLLRVLRAPRVQGFAITRYMLAVLFQGPSDTVPG